jgi:2-polyprenyl-3-methyl-5-hydroxy-6-metoxy-1,4-benzoquinol methylase
MPTSERNCPVCHSHKRELIFHQQFTGISDGSLLDSYDLAVCKKCGFAYADNIPDQEVFDTYYQDMSKYEYQDRSGEESPQNLARLQNIADKIIGFLSPDARILEIGCATGKFLSILKEKGYTKVTGLDPSPVCTETAKKLYDISVYNYNLWNLPVPEEKFDCIVMNAVLEHIRDLDLCLNKITALLSTDGLLQIEVPDASKFSEFVGAPFQEFSTEHINFFSPTSLHNLLQLHGYEKLFSEQKECQQSDNTVMPVIILVYKYTGKCNKEVIFDASTGHSLLTYISKSQTIEVKLQQTIDLIVRDKTAIMVWGVGTHTQRLIATSNLSQANILAFIDSNSRYQGKYLNNIPIISPIDLLEHHNPIVISSQVFQSEIKKQIENDLNLPNELVLLY